MTASTFPENLPYAGGELGLFADAENWKIYWSTQVRPFLKGSVLDVGAGIGSSAKYLARSVSKWTAVEPDHALVAHLKTRVARGELPANVEAIHGTLAAVHEGEYDSVLYADVIEHIADDAAELREALKYLRPGGHLVVLCPAHQSLYSPFDKAIGHFRRYDKKMMRAAGPRGASEVVLRYLDSVGLAASAANRLLLRQSMPTKKQIATWDGLMVPLSRFVDPLIGYVAGKSILAVWRKD